MAKQNVLIVDDHPVVRSGLVQLINQQSGLCVCAEAGTAQEAIRLAKVAEPDLIVLDVSLGNSSGLTIIKDLRLLEKRFSILVLSMHDELLYAERALRAGAQGYVMKDAPPEVVVHAMRQVLAGDIYLSPAMSLRMVNRLVNNRKPVGSSPLSLLTNRELEIFELIGRGSKTSSIADHLHLSVKTIEAHRANIKKKLNLKDHIELLQTATSWTQSAEAEKANE